MLKWLASWTLLALMAAGIGAAPAYAQSYPSRPITIILPLAAGTGMDVIVRLYGDQLSQTLGKPVVIDNRPGAFQMLAVNGAAAQPADGHTLLAVTSAALSISPSIVKEMQHSAAKEFIPISLYVKSPFILIVDPALPVKSVKELVAYSKERPGQMTYSSPGVGGAPQLALELMKLKFGLDITHVPYKNSPQSIADVAAGHVNMEFAEAGASLPLIKDGKLRALAVSSTVRFKTLPDVPTFAEATGTDFEAVSWHALLVREGTPQDIVDRLHSEMTRIILAPDMQEKIANLGLIPLDPPPIAEIRRYVQSEAEKWGGIVHQLGLEATQ
jgi:tripartite-type tricarboxylate transporter receptor subunit TctC